MVSTNAARMGWRRGVRLELQIHSATSSLPTVERPLCTFSLTAAVLGEVAASDEAWALESAFQ
jgi:hypothetical protein